jgi:DNA-binding transcriptional ArsR family regulator
MSASATKSRHETRDWDAASARLLRLADPARLAILERLAVSRPMTLAEVADALDFHEEVATYHVRVLLHSGYIVAERPSYPGQPTLFRLSISGMLAYTFLGTLADGP